MKRFYLFITLAMAAIAAFALSSCNKEEENNTSEVGKWYSYDNAEKTKVGLVIELKANGSADLIITAWGERWLGTYTYEESQITFTYTQFQRRFKAWESAEEATDINHLYDWWDDESRIDPYADYEPDFFGGKTFKLDFKVNGKTAETVIANRPMTLERQ